MELLEQELALCRAENNELWAAGVAELLASFCMWRGEYDRANKLLDEYAGLVREQGGATHMTYLLVRGHLALLQKNTERASEVFGECLSISRGNRDKAGILTALWNLSLVAQDRADYATARALLTETLTLARELGTEEMTAGSMLNLASIERLEGSLAEAEHLYRDSLKIYCHINIKAGIPWTLEGLGKLAVFAGQWKRAARLFGTAEALREAIGRPLPPNSQEDYDRHVALLRAGLEGEAFAAAWEEGRALTVEQAVEEALHSL
jgi:tetratricopeptide (TPR) repeat protein